MPRCNTQSDCCVDVELMAQRDSSLAKVNLGRAKLLFVLACSLCLNEFQSRRVQAITEMGWRWAVVKHVPQVSIALLALDLASDHTERQIALGADIFWSNRGPEARPPGSRFEFRIRTEKRVVTANAPVDSLFVIVPILACKSALRSLLSGDLELLGIEHLLPFFVCLHHFFDHNLSFSLAGVGEFHQGYQAGFAVAPGNPRPWRGSACDASQAQCASHRKSSSEESPAAQALVF